MVLSITDSAEHAARLKRLSDEIERRARVYAAERAFAIAPPAPDMTEAEWLYHLARLYTAMRSAAALPQDVSVQLDILAPYLDELTPDDLPDSAAVADLLDYALTRWRWENWRASAAMLLHLSEGAEGDRELECARQMVRSQRAEFDCREVVAGKGEDSTWVSMLAQRWSRVRCLQRATPPKPYVYQIAPVLQRLTDREPPHPEPPSWFVACRSEAEARA